MVGPERVEPSQLSRRRVEGDDKFPPHWIVLGRVVQGLLDLPLLAGRQPPAVGLDLEDHETLGRIVAQVLTVVTARSIDRLRAGV
jgi:hypothetical protein